MARTSRTVVKLDADTQAAIETLHQVNEIYNAGLNYDAERSVPIALESNATPVGDKLLCGCGSHVVASDSAELVSDVRTGTYPKGHKYAGYCKVTFVSYVIYQSMMDLRWYVIDNLREEHYDRDHYLLGSSSRYGTVYAAADLRLPANWMIMGVIE